MKDYYEILQVNEKASIEIIEKAYKTLAKKYHPDLQTDETKRKFAEEKLKNLNEAYKVLSDDFLREQYDEELQIERMKNLKKQMRYQNDNIRFQDEPNYQQESYEINKNNMENSDEKNTNSENKIKQKYKKTNTDVGTFSSMANLVKEIIANRPKTGEKRKITKKDVFAVLLTIIIAIIIGVILWFIPFTNGWMRELIFENPLFSWIGNLFS